VQAETLVQIARALDGRGTAEARKEAERRYFEALHIAVAERHDQLAAEIWSRLVQLATLMDSGMEQAHAWWDHSQAAVRRIGNTVRDQARLHHTLGDIYYREGKYAEAADEQNRAIAAGASMPEHQLEMSSYYGALGNALERQGSAEALRLHERALTIVRDALGRSHPRVIKAQMDYGKALEKRGQLAAARAVLEDALASMPAKYRDSQIDAGKLHAFLSDVSYAEARLDEAAAHGRKSLEIYQRVGAPDRLVAEAYMNLANAELRRDSFASALALYEKALELRKPYLGSDHYVIGVTEGYIADALIGLLRNDEAMVHVREAERIFARGSSRDQATEAWIQLVHGKALVGQRQLGAAVPVLERALQLLEDAPNAENSASSMWALARALHGLGREPGRARQLAERARALFDALGPVGARNRDAVKRFLQQLSPVPASQDAGRGEGTVR
jgi:tetratricopeptide (TPR) repeat protein